MELAAQMQRMAENAGDALQTAVAHWWLGWVEHQCGEFASARAHLETLIQVYEPQQHHALAYVYGHDPGVAAMMWSADVLWPLGYPDQALQRAEAAIALARDLDHPLSLGLALIGGAVQRLNYRRNYHEYRACLAPLIELSAKHGLVFYEPTILLSRGMSLAGSGQLEEGIGQIVQGSRMYEATGALLFGPWRRVQLAEAYAWAGQVQRGLDLVAEALVLTQETGEAFFEAETHRVEGELWRLRGDETRAAASFHEAIEVARRQQARSWELRAATSLARLRQQQGKGQEARGLLARVHDWFTEGFSTQDLQDAKALLDQLSGGSHQRLPDQQ